MKDFLTATLPNNPCSRRYRRVLDGAITVVPSGNACFISSHSRLKDFLRSRRLSSLSELASLCESFLLRPHLRKFAHDFVVLILLMV